MIFLFAQALMCFNFESIIIIMYYLTFNCICRLKLITKSYHSSIQVVIIE